jgi:hypothetical protein
VFLGPFAKPAPGSGTVVLTPPSRVFKVQDAVSLALGDLDGDGLDDLFFRSSSAAKSPVFYLDAFGLSKAGMNGSGQQLPSLQLQTQPSQGNVAGEGIGSAAPIVGGTTSYGTVHDRSGSFDLFVEDGDLHFTIVDRGGLLHEVETPLLGPDDPELQNGFQHVQAEWSRPRGCCSSRGPPLEPGPRGHVGRCALRRGRGQPRLPPRLGPRQPVPRARLGFRRRAPLERAAQPAGRRRRRGARRVGTTARRRRTRARPTSTTTASAMPAPPASRTWASAGRARSC